MNDWEDYFAYIQRTPKQNSDLLPKRALVTKLDEKDFIYAWFKQTNFSRKLNLAFTYGLVSLDNNQRFIVQNSMSRNYEDMRLQILEAIYWRDGASCAYCFKDILLGNGEIDHLIPRSAWRKEWLWLADDSSNLVAACKPCNQNKSNFYKSFQGENRMSHVSFDCKSPVKYDYECCKSRATDQGQVLCQVCEYDIEVVCRVHQEVRLPACEIAVLKPWFNHA